MRLDAIPIAAIVALGLAVAACQSPSPVPPNPSVGVSASTQPQATNVPQLPPREDPYAEAAEHFNLPADALSTAMTDTRIEMVRIGGEAGQNLDGVDPEPAPLDQGAHLDPRVITFFAGRLGVPESQARAVMDFLLAEWNEYDEESDENNRENNNPTVDAAVSRMATVLKISKERAAWYLSLMIGRPPGPVPQGDDPDRLEQAIIDALGVTPAQFRQAGK
jgi:hypothetical protein